MSFLKRINSSVLIAIGIVVVATIWVLSGVLGGHEEKAMAAPINAQAASADKGKPMVRVRVARNEAHVADLVLRGRTEAEHKVQLKSEMAGRVVDLPAGKGQVVKAGDPICQLDVGARTAQLDQAKAALKQAKLEFDAATTLGAKGQRAETQVAASAAAYEQAAANVRLMETQFGYTVMRAPFDGIVDQRMVSIGDYMVAGTPCAWVVGSDPFLIVGAVSESQIAAIATGTEGTARLVTGESVEGKVTFLANAADAQTRTFRVEMTVPNPDFRLHDGVTADIRIKSRIIPAVRLSPAILSLDDTGKVGVKIVQDGIAHFIAVTMIEDSKDGVWVAGLPDQAMVITVGQDYVKEGDAVNAVPEESVTASGETPAPAKTN